MSDPGTSPSPETSPTHARIRARGKRRIPAIWIIPLLAVAIGLWLGWDTYSKKGPTITVSFESAEGLQAGQSELKFKELTIGTITALELTPDHNRVIATIETTREARDLLNDKTLFWVVKPRLFAGTLSGLGTLISGSYIGMRPGPAGGRSVHDFTGLEDPPVQETSVPGTTYKVKAARLGSISVGSPVFFRDLNVGEVLGWDLADMANSVNVSVFVHAPFDKYVHDRSRFWDASGFSVKLGATGVDVQVQSVKAILLGGIAFDNPADLDASMLAQARPDHEFPLFASQTAAEASVFGRKVQLVAYFSGSVGGLAPGNDVTLHGLKVGEVTSVSLKYDPAQNKIVVPVYFNMEPERVLGVGNRLFSDLKVAATAMLNQGLRASLQSASLITGQLVVALEFPPGAAPSPLVMDGDAFVIPSVDSGGFAELSSAATALLNKVNAMPFDRIGASLANTLDGTDRLVNGPEMKQSMAALSSSLATLQGVLKQVDAGLAPTLKQLPDLTAKTQKAIGEATTLLQSLESGYGDNTKFNRDLDRLLVQVDGAVQSIRSLVDLLQRHPEMLIQGRPGGQQ